jgi:prephenate dehydrogenase
MINSIAIIGYGKFGKIIERLLKKHSLAEINIYDPYLTDPSISKNISQLIGNSDLIIIATPLQYLKSSIEEIKPYLTSKQIIMEVCSTNVYPKKILLEKLPIDIQVIGSHPMFGPQTLAYNNHKVQGFNFVIENIRTETNTFTLIYNFLEKMGFNVIEMSAEDHDKKAAKFHFLAQLVGNSLSPMCLEQTEIDTVSYEFLFNFMKRLDPDPELLDMMYTYNPYSKRYLERYKNSINNLYDELNKK